MAYISDMGAPQDIFQYPFPMSITTPSRTAALADARGRLTALYGERLRSVVLFGSQARGDAGSESDIDLLVVLDGPLDPYEEAKRLARLERDLFERYRLDFAFMPYDEAAYADLRRPFMRNVHREGVEL